MRTTIYLATSDGVSDEVANKMVEIANSRMPPLVRLELQQLGGALARQEDSAMAYTAPKAPFYFKVVSPALNTTLQELAPITKEAVRSLGPVYTDEMSYNWMRATAIKYFSCVWSREIQAAAILEASVRFCKRLSPESQYSPIERAGIRQSTVVGCSQALVTRERDQLDARAEYQPFHGSSGSA